MRYALPFHLLFQNWPRYVTAKTIITNRPPYDEYPSFRRRFPIYFRFKRRRESFRNNIVTNVFRLRSFVDLTNIKVNILDFYGRFRYNFILDVEENRFEGKLPRTCLA